MSHPQWLVVLDLGLLLCRFYIPVGFGYYKRISWLCYRVLLPTQREEWTGS